MIMDGGGAARYRLDLYASISNLFNTVNLNQFVWKINCRPTGQAVMSQRRRARSSSACR